MNNIFISSDPHFKHYNGVLHCNRKPWIINNPNYDCNKPYHFKNNNPLAVNLEKHDNDLISNWNSIVSKGDIVYILGDFAWKDHNHYIMALNGKKIMILGNHDKMSQEVLKNFTEVYDFGVRKKINGQDISLSHYAMRTWASSCHGSWQLYGHSHARLWEPWDALSFDVGMDCWNYRPVPWEIIKKKMAIKQEWIANKKMDLNNENVERNDNSRYFSKTSDELQLKNAEIWK
jgi:calcineurin-like phosphoesterase family protein